MKFYIDSFLVDKRALELHKFEANIKYIESNLKKLGFDESLRLLSIFYTPFAPFLAWGRIGLSNSISDVGMKVGEVFPARKAKLFESTFGLEKLFNLTGEAMLFPLDASFLMNGLPFNKFKIHDAMVFDYDEEEIAVLVALPDGTNSMINWLDINSKTYSELKKRNISSGDILRIVTANLNSSWSMIQLLLFKRVLKEIDWRSDLQKAKRYSSLVSTFNYKLR